MHKAKFVSVEQLVNSYYVATTIDDIRKNGKCSEIVLSGKQDFFEDWLANTKDPELLDLNRRFIEITRFNFKLAAIAKVAIEDMDVFMFKNSPSVTQNMKDSEHIRKKTSPSEFDILRRVDLHEHTKHVFKNIVDEMDKREVYNSGGIMLAALLHDFGKSQEIRKKITPTTINESSSDYRHHADVSGMYIKEVLHEKARNFLIYAKQDQEIRKTIDTIAEIVENHHNKSSAWVKKTELLNAADWKARKDELNSFKS